MPKMTKIVQISRNSQSNRKNIDEHQIIYQFILRATIRIGIKSNENPKEEAINSLIVYGGKN